MTRGLNPTADYADFADIIPGSARALAFHVRRPRRTFSPDLFLIRFIRVIRGSDAFLTKICGSANKSTFWLTASADQRNSASDS